MRFAGKVLWFVGLVGLISPWLPDPDDHTASDDLTGWALVAWLAVSAAIALLGLVLAHWADRQAIR